MPASLRLKGRHQVICAAIRRDCSVRLLGHERGAFTGAHQRKQGQFEHAHHGTIFLDESANLPLALQQSSCTLLQTFASRGRGHEVIKLRTRDRGH